MANAIGAVPIFFSNVTRFCHFRRAGIFLLNSKTQEKALASEKYLNILYANNCIQAYNMINIADLLKALGDETRLRLARLAIQKKCNCPSHRSGAFVITGIVSARGKGNLQHVTSGR